MADTNALRERRKETTSNFLEDDSLTRTTTNVSSSPATEKKVKKSLNKIAADEDAAPFSLVDILRSLVFILIASCGLSYVITRNSYFWGVKRPNWAHVEVLKTYWVSGFFTLFAFTGFERREIEGADGNAMSKCI